MMKQLTITLITSVIMAGFSLTGSAQSYDGTTLPEDTKVIVGSDTVSMILPERNISRYDRGLYNYLFIPKGQWGFGLTASYGELSTEDVQFLSVMKNLDFSGKMYSIKPTVSYMFKHNQSIGLRFNYTRGEANLASMSVDFDDDLEFDLKDVSYFSRSFGVSVFYRNYVGLGMSKRFAIFNEVDLGVGSGSSRFKRLYDGDMRDTRTVSTSLALNFSPGVTMFIMDNVCFNVSLGVFGLHLTHQSQKTNDVEEGSRTYSGANFRFNLFNINFGLGVFI